MEIILQKDLVDQIKNGFSAEIAELGSPEASIDFFEVTGAFEIPLYARRLAETGAYDAVVVAGLVVAGGIYRHEHEDHRDFFFNHLETKGVEAARACAHTVDAIDRLPSPR